MSPKTKITIDQTELIKEWSFEKNGELSPSTVFVTDKIKVWWVCKNGHKWLTSPLNRKTNNSGCHCCSSKISSPEYNLAHNYPHLLKEWDYDKNIKQPEQYLPYSCQKVWWKCCVGHSWKASIRHRSKSKSNCPVCMSGFKSSRLEMRSILEMQKCFPDIIGQYSFMGNSYDAFIPSLNLILEFDGERWHRDIMKDKKKNESLIENGFTIIRIRETPLPFIGNFDVGYQSREEHIDVINRVISSINRRFAINKEQILSYSFNNEYLKIVNRPCKNKPSLLEKYPEIAKFWHPHLNMEITPDNVYPRSTLNVWWFCPTCGNSYQKKVFSRIDNGCPFCSGKKVWDGNSLIKISPEVSKDWDFSKNKKSIEEITNSSRLKVWWKCRFCGDEREESVRQRTKRHKCTVCHMHSKSQYRRELRDVDSGKVNEEVVKLVEKMPKYRDDQKIKLQKPGIGTAVMELDGRRPTDVEADIITVYK